MAEVGKGGWVGSMTKGWKNGLRGLSSFRTLSWLSEVEERGSIHVNEETSKVGYSYCKEACYILFFSLFLGLNTRFSLSHFYYPQVSQCQSRVYISERSLLISPKICLKASNNFRRVLVRFKHAKEEVRYLRFGQRANTRENKCYAWISLI